MIRRFVVRGGQPRDLQSHLDESGQGLAEYALILALIAVVCVGALQVLGVDIANTAGYTTLPMAI